MSVAKRRHQYTAGRAINVSFASGIRVSGGNLRSYSSGGGSCYSDSISDARSRGGDVGVSAVTSEVAAMTSEVVALT